MKKFLFTFFFFYQKYISLKIICFVIYDFLLPGSGSGWPKWTDPNGSGSETLFFLPIQTCSLARAETDVQTFIAHSATKFDSLPWIIPGFAPPDPKGCIAEKAIYFIQNHIHDTISLHFALCLNFLYAFLRTETADYMSKSLSHFYLFWYNFLLCLFEQKSVSKFKFS